VTSQCRTLASTAQEARRDASCQRRHRTLALGVALACMDAAAAARAQSAPPRDSASVVERVSVERRPVFDKVPTASWYERLGNRIHVVTRPFVIERELLVRRGAPADSTLIAETERNLRGLGLFAEVRIDTSMGPQGTAVAVTTRDAWSTKLTVSLSASGSQAALKISAAESNLLGLGVTVGASFRHDPDRDAWQLNFNAPRTIRNRVGVRAMLDNLTDGRRATASITAPFFSLSARDSAGVAVEWFDGTVLRFRDGDPEPADSLHRRFGIVRFGAATAVRRAKTGYLRIGLTAQARREDFIPDTSTAMMPRTLTGALLLVGEHRSARFFEMLNYRALGSTEDIDVGLRTSVGVSLAPVAWGYDQNGVGGLFSIDFGTRIPRGFVQLGVDGTSLFNSGGLDSGTVRGSGTVAIGLTESSTFVANLSGGVQREPAPGAELDLGLTVGPRAYPAHAFTGDRAYFVMAEYRQIIARNVAKLMNIGVAAFVERGGAWFAGQPRRGGSDAGIGFRFASPRASAPHGATRIDLARRFATDREPAKWIVVFGTGYPFERIP
jgi:hypothetical protein